MLLLVLDLKVRNRVTGAVTAAPPSRGEGPRERCLSPERRREGGPGEAGVMSFPRY